MLKQSLKSLAAFVGTFIGAVILSVQDRTDLGSMGATEWGSVLLAALGVAVLTWLVPNYNYPTKPAP